MGIQQADMRTLPAIARRALAPAGNPWALAGLVGLAAAVVLWLMVQPLAGAANDTDAAATVLYFDRIIHGQRLEAFVPTTPKPLLTLVYGVAWNLTHDWRALTVLSIGVGAAAVAMAARLAARIGGSAAAVVVVLGLLAWPDFGLEVAHANSFVWGLALWLLAGVLITADTPRPWLAGLSLALAGLARTETVWLLGAVAVCVAWIGLRALRGGDRSQLRLTLPLLVGALAVPIACLHDLLLTGHPFYWLGVPGGYTALAYPDLGSTSLLSSARDVLAYYRPAAPLLLLALAGGLWLGFSRHRAIALALASLAGGVVLTLMLLASRAVFISIRYYEEADAAILLAAAVGASALIDWSLVRTGSRLADRSAWRAVACAVVAAVLAIGVIALDVPRGTLGPQVARSNEAYAALQARIPDLKVILVGAEGMAVDVRGVDYPVADAASCRLYVPRPLVPVISVETGAPITALGDSYLAFRGSNYALSPGQWVLHISAADGSGGFYSPFEHAGPTTLVAADGRLLSVVPVVADPQGGLWLDRIDAPPAIAG